MSDFKNLAVLTIDLLGTGPADLMHIANYIAKVAQDKQAAIEENAKRQKQLEELMKSGGPSAPPQVPEVPTQN